MLQLDRGRAMRHLTAALEDMDYRWAYRVVDARAFGLPQRRLRVLLLASRTEDPRQVLFADDADAAARSRPRSARLRVLLDRRSPRAGMGGRRHTHAQGRVDHRHRQPAGGPAGQRTGGWSPRGSRTPSGCRAFPPGGRRAAVEDAGTRPGHRWKLVGNAVSVPVAKWLGGQLVEPGTYDAAGDRALQPGDAWPTAAWGRDGVAHRAAVGQWPARRPYRHLEGFLRDPAPLSQRATAGFLRRAETQLAAVRGRVPRRCPRSSPVDRKAGLEPRCVARLAL